MTEPEHTPESLEARLEAISYEQRQGNPNLTGVAEDAIDAYEATLEENQRLREKYLDPDCCGMMHYSDCHLLADDPVTNVAPIEGSDGWTDTQDGDEA